MEREQMIEEMIRDFYGDMDYVTSEMIQDSIKRGDYVDFVKMYDLGYRKIPDDALVLTQEELNTKHIFDDDMFLRVLDAERELGRKEMGERIYEKAKKKKYVDNDDEGYYWGAIALDDLADICGVEVE